MKRFRSATLALAVLAVGASAKADVKVYAGYYDIAPCCGNPNPLPDPWMGSANTTFFGDVGGFAGPNDPDEAALRLENTGATAVTINPGFAVGSNVFWDGFIGSGFVLGAGQNLVFSGTAAHSMDGSDLSLGSSVTVKLNGLTFGFQDTDNLLKGFPVMADETLPWTSLGVIRVGDTSGGVPEPASWALLICGFGLVSAELRRRRTAQFRDRGRQDTVQGLVA